MKRTTQMIAFALMLTLAFNLHAKDTKTIPFNLVGDTQHASIEIKIELPALDQGPALELVRTKLIEMMDRQLAFGYDADPKRVFRAYDGDPRDSKNLVKYYFTKTKEALEKESKENADYYEDNGWHLDYSWSMTKCFENDRIIVFLSEGFVSSSTMMHPSPFGQGPVTFDKKDGHVIKNFFKANIDLHDIRPLLYRGLGEYFREGDELKNNFDEMLSLDEYLIPLPKQAPCPVESGLVIKYRESEITVTFAGEPHFFVFYDEVLPYLSSDVLRNILGYKDCTKELSTRALELCRYIPDHGVIDDSERFMTPDFFRAVSEAFDAPEGFYGEIGDNEWLFYFVTGQEGFPYYRVKDVFMVDEDTAIADITVNPIIYEISNKPLDEVHDHQIEMKRIDGKWLLSDFDKVKQKCFDYVKEMRRKYKTGEIINRLLSDEYTKKDVPRFKKDLEEFYRKYSIYEYGTEPKPAVFSDPSVFSLPAKDGNVVPFSEAEKKPSFNGKDLNAFMKWVYSLVEYPADAKEYGFQGRVTVQFTIATDGSLENLSVAKGVCESLDREALRVVSSSPKWTPGMKDGYRVPVSIQIPVIFQLR